MKDYSSITFSKEDEFLNFLIDREKEDKWITLPLGFTKFRCVYDAPIAVPTMIADIEGYESDEDSLTDVLSEGGYVMSYFNADTERFESYPMRFTATHSALDVLGCLCPVFANIKPGFLDRETKGQWLTAVCQLPNYKNKEVKILVRDGKIGTVRSDHYAPLSAAKMFEGLMTKAQEYWSEIHFKGGEVDHMYTQCTCEYGSEEEREELAKEFEDAGISCSSISLALNFITSDTGHRAVQLTPTITIDGMEMAFGEPFKMVHEVGAGASMEKWEEEILPQLTVFPKKVAETLRHLQEIEILNPGGCLKGIGEKIGIPRRGLQHTAEEMDAMYEKCTALDVYYTLNECAYLLEQGVISVAAKDQEELTITQKLRIRELPNKALRLNFKDFDAPLK